MQAKLTLRMDEELIAQAKQIAKENGKSVSRMFTDYIKQFQMKNNRKDVEIEEPLPPLTQQLLDLIPKDKRIPITLEEEKQLYRDYLYEKYMGNSQD